MEHLTKITYKGNQIFLLDGSGGPEVLLETISQARKEIDLQPPKSVLIITDVTRAEWDGKVIQALKNFTRDNTPFIKASAVVGVTGLNRIMLETVKRITGREFGICKDIEEAKEWLIRQ